jgi:PAS domain S-box-containing protein
MSQTSGFDFQLIFENTPTSYLILAADPNFTIIAANSAFFKATSTEKQKILNRALFEIFPDNPNDPDASGSKNWLASLNRIKQNLVTDRMPITKYAIRSATAQFEDHYWIPTNTPVIGEDGSLKFIIHQVEDVTKFMLLQQKSTESTFRAEKLQAELYQHVESVRIATERYYLLTSILPVGIFHADPEGHLLYVNPQWQEISGFDIAQSKGDPWFARVLAVDFPYVSEAWEQSRKNQNSFKEEFRFPFPEGRERWVLAEAVPVLKGDNIVSYVGSITDITERRNREVEQLKRTQEMAALDRAKTVFFSNISHELRTPLTLILAPLEDLLAE